MKRSSIPKITALILFTAQLCVVISAEGQQLVVPHKGPVYEFALPESTFFDALEFKAPQRKSQWCWAKCVEICFRYRGVPLDQNQIVEKIKRRIIDSGGTAAEIVEALKSRFELADGTRVSSGANWVSRENGISVVNHSIQASSPVIALLNDQKTGVGHAILITAVCVDISGRPFFYEVYDPQIRWVSDVPNAKRRAYKYAYFADQIENQITGFVFPMIITSKIVEEDKRIRYAQSRAGCDW